MKNPFALILMILLLSSCDPTAVMEANIENSTNQTLTIDFISSDESWSKSIQIQPNQIRLFQEGFDIGNTFLEPSLTEYDSVVVKNQAEAILKVYKVTDNGKNIYNVDEYWKASEPSKWSFKYLYVIESEDIE